MRLTVYIFFILSLLMAGCEKEDKLLIGKWNKVSSELVTYNGNDVISDTTYYYESGKNILELLADGTARTNKYDDLMVTYKWMISGKYLIINYYTDRYLGSNSDRFEYSVKDSVLTLRTSGYSKPRDNKYRFVMTDIYTGF